jgi:hypothetical protein
VLFFISRESFFASGIGLERLLTTSFTFGFCFLAHIRLLSGKKIKSKKSMKKQIQPQRHAGNQHPYKEYLQNVLYSFQFQFIIGFAEKHITF